MKYAAFSATFISGLSLLFSPATAGAATSSACPGEEGYYFTNYKHRNPTKGGFVSNKADVQDTDDMIFIGPNVAICGSSRVSGKARIFGDAVINGATVKGQAEISENALIDKGAEVSGNARISGKARVSGFVEVTDDAIVTDSARVLNTDSEKLTRIAEKARVGGNAYVTADASVSGRARVNGNATLSGDVRVEGSAIVKGYTKRSKGLIDKETLDEPDYEAIERARREHEAYLAKCAEEEALKKAAADAAAIQKQLETQQAEENRLKRLADLRGDLKKLGQETGYTFTFDKTGCNFIAKSEGVEAPFVLSKASNSIDRVNGRSGFSIYTPTSRGTEIRMESDPKADRKYNVLSFTLGSNGRAKKLKDDFDFYFQQCQDGAEMGKVQP